MPLEELIRDADENNETGRSDLDLDVPDNPLSGLGLGPVFFEKFLIAIIDAHPLGRHSGSPIVRRQRLDAAMRALVGHKSFPFPLPGDRDEGAIIWMAGEQYNRRPRVSDLALATEAAKKFFGDDALVRSNAHRLREKYSGAYNKKLARRKDKNRGDTVASGSEVQSVRDQTESVDYRRTYRYQALEHDYVVESIELQSLNRLKVEFAYFGIKMEIR